jgi:hypothetical protein
MFDFCERADKLLSAMVQQGGASAAVFEKTKAILEGIRGVPFGAWGIIMEGARPRLEKELNEGGAAFVNMMPADQRGMQKEMWDVQASTASLFLPGLVMCRLISPSDRQKIEAQRRWQKDNAVLRQERDTLDKKIAGLSQTGSGLGAMLESLWRNFWPFVLVAALGLKFAKSMTAFRK